MEEASNLKEKLDASIATALERRYQAECEAVAAFHRVTASAAAECQPLPSTFVLQVRALQSDAIIQWLEHWDAQLQLSPWVRC